MRKSLQRAVKVFFLCHAFHFAIDGQHGDDTWQTLFNQQEVLSWLISKSIQSTFSWAVYLIVRESQKALIIHAKGIPEKDTMAGLLRSSSPSN